MRNNQDRLIFRRWLRFRRALWAVPVPPVSERFVQNVMSRIHALEKAVMDVFWPRFARWAFPALALAAAGFMMTLSIPPIETALSRENLILDQPSVTALVLDEE